MPELRVRNRARLREKEAERIAQELEQRFGARPWPQGAPVDRAESGQGDVLIVKEQLRGFVLPGATEVIAPTVRSLLETPPTKSFVTVDMGAIKFVNNGADIMGPGIVEADAAIQAGDLVWIRDERHKRPLAVGQALSPGAEMPKQPGKKVKNLHRVGDELWSWEP